MPQIRTNCPRCKAPVTAEVQQLIDVGVDPSLKQKLLGGTLNSVACPACGYQGGLSTPVVYHDPEKEMLLTFFPPELGLPADQQEKQIGPLITQVVNNLAPEKRKAYLFRPQTMFTYQTLIEKVLEGEGITKEMIEGQQVRLRLLQRLLSTPDANSRKEIIKQEESIIDETFFALLNRLGEAAMAEGDQNLLGVLSEVQAVALAETEAGRRIKSQSDEAQEALKSLQEASKTGLTREKLLALIIAAPTDVRLNTLVSLTRSGLDYQFFQILTDRIEVAEGDEKQRLLDLRSKVMEITSEIDKQIQAQMEGSRKLLQRILQSPNIEQATTEALPEIDEFFAEILNSELQQARKASDLERIGKLNQINQVLEKASAPPPEFALIEQLMAAPDADSLRNLLQEHQDDVNSEFLQLLSGLIAQSDQQGQPPEVSQRLQEVYNAALRFSMEKSFKS